jgi:RimJ/RimL family protein N-acetyltransferase
VAFDKQAGRYAGSTSFCNVSDKDNKLEIGYTWIGYDFQRTGLNRAIKSLMLQYAFDTLGFHRVEFTADSRNQQSRAAIAAIGATFESELRSRIVKPDGYRANTVYYSILAHEWPRIKKEVFGINA